MNTLRLKPVHALILGFFFVSPHLAHAQDLGVTMYAAPTTGVMAAPIVPSYTGVGAPSIAAVGSSYGTPLANYNANTAAIGANYETNLNNVVMANQSYMQNQASNLDLASMSAQRSYNALPNSVINQPFAPTWQASYQPALNAYEGSLATAGSAMASGYSSSSLLWGYQMAGAGQMLMAQNNAMNNALQTPTRFNVDVSTPAFGGYMADGGDLGGYGFSGMDVGGYDTNRVAMNTAAYNDAGNPWAPEMASGLGQSRGITFGDNGDMGASRGGASVTLPELSVTAGQPVTPPTFGYGGVPAGSGVTAGSNGIMLEGDVGNSQAFEASGGNSTGNKPIGLLRATDDDAGYMGWSFNGANGSSRIGGTLSRADGL